MYGGFADVGLTIVMARPSAFYELPAVLATLSAATATVLVLYVTCWVIAGVYFRSIARSQRQGLPVLVAICACIPAPLVSVLSVRTVDLDATGWLVMGICGATFLLAAIRVYRVFRLRLHRLQLSPRSATACVAGPCILATVCGLLWWHSYRTAAPSVWVWCALVVGVSVCTVITWVLARRLPRLRVERLVAPFIAVVVLGPLGRLAVPPDVQAGSAAGAADAHAIRHVVLLTVDSLRADVLSCYGSGRVQTPNIDRLARDGTRFRRAVSPGPWTLPAFTSIMSGVYPSVHGVRNTFWAQIPGELETLAERMQAAGYRTAAIGDNPFLVTESRMSQGFQEYRFFAGPRVRRGMGGRVLESLFGDRFRAAATSGDLTRMACEWVSESAGQAFFLWLHYLDPHTPYAPPTEYVPDGEPPDGLGTAFDDTEGVRTGFVATRPLEREWIAGLYEAEVRYVDDCIGRVLDTLDRLGIYEETLIVFLSDHGEEFWDHDGYEHGHTLYDELIRVPLIVKGPGIGGGRCVEQLVSTAAVTPTICDLCRIPCDSRNLSVGSFAPALHGAGPETVGPVYSAGVLYYEDREAVIFDGLKYVRSTVTGREHLYDLANDPAERTSLVSLAPDRLLDARTVMKQMLESAHRLRAQYFGPDATQRDRAALSRHRLEQLRSLGYVQ
jgi:arylsulfatase A-like enzyme